MTDFSLQHDQWRLPHVMLVTWVIFGHTTDATDDMGACAAVFYFMHAWVSPKFTG